MQTLESRMESLDKKFDAKFDVLQASVLTLQASVMPRAEIETADNRRVSVEMYNTAQQALIERLTKLENGPQKLLGWVGAGLGCFSLCVTALGVLVAILIALVPHLK